MLTKSMCVYIIWVITHPRCGEAIKQNDLKLAIQIITKLCELSSPNGNGVQCMSHYITNALVKDHKMLDKMIILKTSFMYPLTIM